MSQVRNENQVLKHASGSGTCAQKCESVCASLLSADELRLRNTGAGLTCEIHSFLKLSPKLIRLHIQAFLFQLYEA